MNCSCSSMLRRIDIHITALHENLLKKTPTCDGDVSTTSVSPSLSRHISRLHAMTFVIFDPTASSCALRGNGILTARLQPQFQQTSPKGYCFRCSDIQKSLQSPLVNTASVLGFLLLQQFSSKQTFASPILQPNLPSFQTSWLAQTPVCGVHSSCEDRFNL